jgi:nucleotidyltransferase/DNA polymerase involved in DNA repair
MLSLWVPELPFQLACGRDKRLSGRPLAFLSPGGGPTPALWFANRAARSQGIEAGESMDRALRRCPGLEVLDPAPQTWWEALVSFSEFLSKWTPQGMLGRMGEALLDLHGTHDLFGHPKDTASRILRELSGSMGWAGHGGLSGSGTAARLAARMEHGIEFIGSGFEASFLAPHPLKALPSLEAGPLFRLNRLGLFLIRDLQPVPVDLLAHFIDGAKAKKLLQCARGEDRPRLPMLADRPNEARHCWRVEPPAMPDTIPLAPWLLDKIWKEGRSPRRIKLKWWDVDGASHRWSADEVGLSEPPMLVARNVESSFRQKSTRRTLVHRIEAHIAWGLGRPRALFGDDNKKLEAIEPALARLRKRFPGHPVLPGWAKSDLGGKMG